jgi:signal peptide peptidase SppA
MVKIHYAMREDQVNKYLETKQSIIETRNSMNEEQVKIAKEEIIKECKIYDVEVDESGNINTDNLYEIKDGVAMIPVAGMLVQKVDICAAFFGETVTTYRYIREATAKADKDPMVRAIAYLHNSGGGVVSGVDITAQAIRSVKKPTLAIVYDMSASGSYWLASATDKIVSVVNTSFIGSIGVATEIIDRSKADNDMGIKRMTFTNQSSKDKRPDMLTKEGQEILVKELDDIYNVFVNAILEKRNEQLSKEKIDTFSGRVFIASEAIENGLVDDMTTEDVALSYNYITNRENPTYVGNNNEGENLNMKLSEFLEKNPEAKAEQEALIDSAKAEAVKDAVQKQVNEQITAERANMKKIVELSGGTLNKNALECIEKGKTPEQYALMEMEEQKKKNAGNPQNLGEFNTKTEIVPEKTEEDEVKQKNINKVDEVYDKMYAKKEDK